MFKSYLLYHGAANDYHQKLEETKNFIIEVGFINKMEFGEVALTHLNTLYTLQQELLRMTEDLTVITELKKKNN